MALQTITTIKIGETIIRNFTKLTIAQKIHDHHTFSLQVRQDLLVNEFTSVMPVSQTLYGEKISIEIKPIEGLDDPMIKADPQSYVLQFYGIVAEVSMQKSCIENIEETLLIEGYSNSFLLENGPESNSFTAMTLSDIVNKAKTGYDVDMQVRPFFKESIAYAVQYNESCFAFLNRLAMRYGQYFYDNGRILIFGDSGGVIQPKLVYGVNMLEFNYRIRLMPVSFTAIENDNREGSYTTDETLNYRRELNGFHENFVAKSNTIFNKKAILQLNQNAVGAYATQTAGEYAKNKMRAVLSGLMEVAASSEVPGVTIGNNVHITGVDKQHESSYRVTEIVHTCDDGGGYENHFKAVNTGNSVFSPKTNPDLVPLCTSQTAVVTANADPDGLSAVKVQMPWQVASGRTTPYIPLVQKYGGNSKGSHWIPEIGEQVFVDFQGNNAELPIVVGTMTSNKEKSGYGTENNDIKALHTRSNNLLLMDDAQGSILLQDSAKSFVEFDGKRKVELNTDVFEINVKKLIINASQSTEITTNDYILNALTSIYVLSKTMQQKISGFMNLFSGSALINSSDKIDIEAKTAKLHGKEKALFHSDKEAVINSKGTAKMHGTEGNSFTNTAKTIDASPINSIALAVVYFRPTATWNGEFGFDWLREADNGMADPNDPAYASIIDGGYRDGLSDYTPGATGTAFAHLKMEYENITITRKPLPAGTPAPAIAPSSDYYVPFLTLFSEEFVNLMPSSVVNKPKYEAELKVLVEIEEEIEKLEFDYDNTLFTIDKIILQDKIKTTGLVNSADGTVKIKCLKDLTSDKEIRIYVYPKGSVAKKPAQQLIERKLAGKIIVLKNDSTVRKEEKIVLSAVKSNVNGVVRTGGFTPSELIGLYNTLHQALIVPIIVEEKINILDLSSNADFQSGGRYINAFNRLNMINLSTGDTIKPTFQEMRNLFLNNPANAIYKAENYYTIFSSLMTANFTSAIGCVEDIGVHNAIMLAGRRDTTLPHEAVHGLGLNHTHKDSSPITEITRKYTFNLRTTTNVISYAPIRTTLWRWQWQIINSNVT